jgi:hypothetical protein
LGSDGFGGSGSGGGASAEGGGTGVGTGGSGSGFATGASATGTSGFALGRGGFGLGRVARVSGAIVTSSTAIGISSGDGGANNLGKPKMNRLPRTRCSATDNAMPGGVTLSGIASRTTGSLVSPGSAVATLIQVKPRDPS